MASFDGTISTMDLKVLAIVGPESTGKTSLASDLGSLYNASIVPEYARAYIDKLDRPYRQEDLLEIAEMQSDLENSMIRKMEEDGMVICDTDLIVIKIWSQVKYGSVDPRIEKLISDSFPRVYLLTKPDLAWEPDPQRENPVDRDWLFDLYEKELKTSSSRYETVGGSGPDRMRNATEGVTKLFS